MKKLIFFILFTSLAFISFSQKSTKNDGEWSKQFLVLRNTSEAELMIRVGDIDNLGFGWEDDFNPFAGKSTPTHDYPWEVRISDAPGTDRIMVPTSYNYNAPKGSEGYTNLTQRPANNPIAIAIPLYELKNIKIDSASLQLFIDDFQAPTMLSKFQCKINGVRFTEAEKMINKIKQDGPIGKLITIRLTTELLQQLKADSLKIFIDDPTTGTGDGFAIDFIKLLINPKTIYKGKVQGRIVDAVTKEPIPAALASIEDFGTVTTNARGEFIIENVPAGLTIVRGFASGYSSEEKQTDVIAQQTSEPIEIELNRSGKVTFNNKTLQEGDNLVINNIQFGVNSSVLLPAGKKELDKIATLMKRNEVMEILLSGHTSSEGSATLNRELSLKRVRSCKDYLTSKGIDDGRITIKGLGPDMPIAPNDTETNRAKNRRVELKITKL